VVQRSYSDAGLALDVELVAQVAGSTPAPPSLQFQVTVTSVLFQPAPLAAGLALGTATGAFLIHLVAGDSASGDAVAGHVAHLAAAGAGVGRLAAGGDIGAQREASVGGVRQA